LVGKPVTGLSRLAKQCGAMLVTINRVATPLDDIADMIHDTSTGETMT